jgi:N-hydroxyarylamine O-acetyltransferase
MTTHAIDLPRYLRRIGWEGAAPTVSTDSLDTIARLHTASIPFENLNPFLGLSVSLELADIERKLVDESRGGYCFEQNRLLAEVLGTIGFEVDCLAARVLWGQPEDAITMRSHMVLKVHTPEGPRVADVGFGGNSLSASLALEDGLSQATPHGSYRVVRRGEQWSVQALVKDEWTTMYRFDLQPQHPVDYEAPNHYTATHPKSHFTTSLTCAIALPGRRLTLRNREFGIHPVGGETQRRELTQASEILDVFESQFGLRVSALDSLTERLNSLA